MINEKELHHLKSWINAYIGAVGKSDYSEGLRDGAAAVLKKIEEIEKEEGRK
jgi:uncharacterized protein (DUF2164 family)